MLVELEKSNWKNEIVKVILKFNYCNFRLDIVV